MEYATYSPKTPAAKVATAKGWLDFNNAPDKFEVYRRQIIADGLVEPKLTVADVVVAELPEETRIGGRYFLRNGWKVVGPNWDKPELNWTSDQIVDGCIRPTDTVKIPVAYWYLFQS